LKLRYFLKTNPCDFHNSEKGLYSSQTTTKYATFTIVTIFAVSLFEHKSFIPYNRHQFSSLFALAILSTISIKNPMIIVIMILGLGLTFLADL